MLHETNDFQIWDSPWETVAASAPAPRWTVLIPFFNERTLLNGTLASLAAQDVPFELILIDNASTDGSAEIAAATCRRLGLAFTLLTDRRPGKVNALQTGVARTRTLYVATCDADTIYPTDYLRQAELLLEATRAVAGGAYFAAQHATAEDHREASARMARAAMLLPGQCHTGGAGQVFRTDALRRAGGFDAARWGYVLEDHEIMHRMAKLGPLAYGGTLWCAPSPRERDRDSIRWTLVERILYHVTPGPARDWFFYDFLGRRLAARRLTSDRIRERQFYAQPDFSGGMPRTA
ncbi:glycosyltransferase family A protein [Sphingomonas sp.]|uniref:glycosyltransferase n=1 Tax=Sphingomonas sp. TaxID=28214 RepID=UPI0033413F28